MTTKDSTAWDSSPQRTVRKLQFLIDTHHVTVQMLADSIGVPHKTLFEVLDGVALPTEGFIRKCAEYFEVPLEFVSGQGTSSKSKEGVTKSRSPQKTARASKEAKGTGRTRSSQRTPSRRSQEQASESLNVRTLAIRHQALLELLIEKRVLTPQEYHDQVKRIEERGH